MGTIEEIIKTIDDRLIETRKEYISLGQANQLLVSENIISTDEKSRGVLKKLLEGYKISHAYQTESTPRQWRIPLSEEGKKRKPKTIKKKKPVRPKTPNYNTFDNTNWAISQVICPNCGQNLIIPPEIINDLFFRCLNCGGVFRNPLKINNEQDLSCGDTFRNPLKTNNGQGLTKTKRNWFIGIAAIFVMWIIVSILQDDDNSPVRNSGYDASVRQVESYLKNNLKDPKSYESMEWSAVERTGNGGYKVRHKYRAKNSFGGYVTENKVFYLDANGNVVE